MWQMWIRAMGGLWPMAGRMAMLIPKGMTNSGDIGGLINMARSLVAKPAPAPWFTLKPASRVASKRVMVFSGCTAPIGAILGAVASQVAGSLLPFALAAAAGAMVYVVIEEVIPEANASGNGNAATVACIGGLCLVMSFSSLVG